MPKHLSNRGTLTGAAALLLMAAWATAAPRVVCQWTFGEPASKTWITQAHQCKDVRVEEGVLYGITAGPDPFLTSPSFSIAATAGQVVEFKARCAAAGKGGLYWIPVGEKGAQAKWLAPFDWHADGEWHDYKIRPFWQGEKRIGAFRIDFPNGQTDRAFAISSMRVVDAGGDGQAGQPEWKGNSLSKWTAYGGAAVQSTDDGVTFRSAEPETSGLESPPLASQADAAFILSVEMAASAGDRGSVSWASDAVSGLHRKTFRIKADGLFHTYNIDLGGEKNWAGNIVLLRVTPVEGKDAHARLRSIVLSEDMRGPADISVVHARMADAINRAGKPAPFLIRFANLGGTDATDVRLAVKRLPEGVRMNSGPGWERVAPIPASAELAHTLELISDRPTSGDVEFDVSVNGAPAPQVKSRIEFLPDPGLPKAAYVPEPRPVKSDYEIGALYYPGWATIEKWARIWPVAPERKPVLGWYDEANPEVVDWQIKWAVENGMSYFLVDWYWHKKYKHNDHWIQAFKRARYKSYLKWAMMWANHNPPGSHSEEDQRAVTKFWADNYFNMPEYYRIDGKPVVMIWSPQNMNRDLGGSDGCKRLLEISRQVARDAGYPGIYFVAMKWPEASWAPEIIQGLKDMGFDMTSIYHYMDHGGKAENQRRFHFDLVADSNAAHWRGLHQTGILPFLPNLSTGWDDRPWHGDKGREIYGRTVKHFQRICRDAKAFADETGIKRMVLAPLNEWGEGSYAEPCAEFGFGMYEAIRDTFCQKPDGGWPLNYIPQDVGLGPYDLPMPPPDSGTHWTFKTGADGWTAAMGISDFSAKNGLRFKTKTADPALERLISPVSAKKYARFVARMSVSACDQPATCQLFWSSGETPTERTTLSLPIKCDGQFHDYAFDLANTRAWRGRVSRLRFDPGNRSGLDVAIESLRLVERQE